MYEESAEIERQYDEQNSDPFVSRPHKKHLSYNDDISETSHYIYLQVKVYRYDMSLRDNNYYPAH